ncbi:MAG: ABC transporter permease [Candidatus Zixiibacteriota bacterium]|nr:MAG: ABC transporter permease [candidate division Zixibacteria bacterium]
MLKNYIKIAWKVLLRRKFFTFVSLFGISFTLLVLMIVAALLTHFLAPAGPGSRLDRSLLVGFVEVYSEDIHMITTPSYYFLDNHVRTMKTPEMVSIHSAPVTINEYVRNNKLELNLKFTDAEFWDIVEMDFVEGRPYDRAAVENATPVTVITEKTGKEYFGQEAPVGKYIAADGINYRVVGVIANEDIPTWEAYADIYVPVTTSKSDLGRVSYYGSFGAYVLAHDKSDFGKIKSELRKRTEKLEPVGDIEFDWLKCYIGTMTDYIGAQILGGVGVGEGFEGTGTYLILIIILGMILFMLLPTINLVNINVSRIIERASEIGIRKAFGASSRTLVGQFIVENVILTLIGGAIGFIISIAALEIVSGSGIVPYGEFTLNMRIFLYCLAICLFFGLFSGVYPAFKMSRLHPVEALRGVDL